MGLQGVGKEIWQTAGCVQSDENGHEEQLIEILHLIVIWCPNLPYLFISFQINSIKWFGQVIDQKEETKACKETLVYSQKKKGKTPKRQITLLSEPQLV